MKLKYKKIILIITMSTMCIGFVTISLSTPVNKSSANSKTEAGDTREDKKEDTQKDGANMIDSVLASGKLKCNAYKEVNELVKQYLDASLKCDMESLKGIVSDVANLNQEELQKKQQLIEAYNNIECYTVDGLQDKQYLVYVYSELKFSGIQTAAPGLTRLFISQDADGALKINLSVMDETVQKFINESAESEEVLKLIDTVNYKLEEAIHSDADLKNFYQQMNEGKSTNDEDAQETDAPLEDTEAANE